MHSDLELGILGLDVAKCNLGKVKLKRVGRWSSPIAARDMRGGHLGIRRALLEFCS